MAAKREKDPGKDATIGIRRYFPGARYLIPEVIVDFKNYLSVSYLRKYCNRPLLSANKAMKNLHAGEEVYVIANGPSLNKVDLTRIYNKKIIVMNHFEQHPLKEQFHIVAHCIGEPYGCKTWEDPELMLKGVRADSYWFSSDAWPYFQGKSGREIHYYCAAVAPKLWLKTGDDLAGPSLSYQSTAQMAIMVALYMGFKVVKLLGFDHDWLVSKGISPHFYEEKDGIAQSDLSIFTYREKIALSLNLFNIYCRIGEIAKRQGTRIVNMSPGSYLDVYEFGDFL